MAGINDWLGEQIGGGLGAAGRGLEAYNNEIVDDVVGDFLAFAARSNLWGPIGGERSRQAVLSAFAKGGHKAAVEAYTQHEGYTRRAVLETALDPLNLLLPLSVPRYLLATGKLAKMGSMGEKLAQSERFGQIAQRAYDIHDPVGSAISQGVVRPARWGAGKVGEAVRGGAPKLENAQKQVFRPADVAAQRTPGGMSAAGQATTWSREIANIGTDLARRGRTLNDVGMAGLIRNQMAKGAPISQEMIDWAADAIRRGEGWAPGAGPDPADSLLKGWDMVRQANVGGTQPLALVKQPFSNMMNPATEIGLNAAFASPGILMAKAADEKKDPFAYLPGAAGIGAAAGLGAIALKKPYLGKATRNVAAGEKFRPGELSRSDYIPNQELFEEYAKSYPDIRYDKDGSGYIMSPKTFRVVSSDPRFTVNQGIPWDELASEQAVKYADRIYQVREQIAKGEMPPELLALSSWLTLFSEGQGARPFREVAGKVGLDWIAENQPTVQPMMQPRTILKTAKNPAGYESTMGPAIRPETFAAARAMMLHDPDIAVGMTALVRPEAFANEAERLAAAEKAIDKLMENSPWGDRGVTTMAAGRPVVRKGIEQKEVKRLPWAKRLPELWNHEILPWSTRSSVEGREATSKNLLDAIKKRMPAGIDTAKSTFLLNMGFVPDFATLDSRMANKVFGLSSKMINPLKGQYADLYQRLEDMVAEKLPGVESKYVRQWLPWQFISGENTEYTSIINKLDEFAKFYTQAETRAKAEGRPMGEVVREMSEAYPKPEVMPGDMTPSTGTWLGITMKDVAANLQPGADVDEILRLYPGIRETADQAGVTIEDMRVGLGQYNKDAARIEEPDFHVLLTGPRQGIEWFAANLAKSGEQREAYVMHPGNTFSMYKVETELGGPGREVFNTKAGEYIWDTLGDNGWHAYFNSDGSLAGFHITDFMSPEDLGPIDRTVYFQGVLARVLDALESEGVQFKQDPIWGRYRNYGVDSLSLNGDNYDAILARGPGQLTGGQGGKAPGKAEGSVLDTSVTRGVGGGPNGSGAAEVPAAGATAVLPDSNPQAAGQVTSLLPEAPSFSPAISELAKLRAVPASDLLGNWTRSVHAFVLPDGSVREVPGGITHAKLAQSIYENLGIETKNFPLTQLLSEGAVRVMVNKGDHLNFEMDGPLTMKQFQALRGLIARNRGGAFAFEFGEPSPGGIKLLASAFTPEEFEPTLRKLGWLPDTGVGIKSSIPWAGMAQNFGPQAVGMGLSQVQNEEGQPAFPWAPSLVSGSAGIMRGQRGIQATAGQVRQALRQFGADNPFGYLKSEDPKLFNPLPKADATAAEAPLPAGATPEMAAAAVEAFIKKRKLGERGYDITGTMTPQGPGVMVSMNNVPKAYVQQVAQAMADGFGVDVHVLQHALGSKQSGKSAVYHGAVDTPAVMEVQLDDLSRVDEIKDILTDRGATWVQIRNPYKGQGQTSFLVFNIDPTTGSGWKRGDFEYTSQEQFISATRQMLADAGARFSPAGGNVQTVKPGGTAPSVAPAPVRATQPAQVISGATQGASRGARATAGNAASGVAGTTSQPAPAGISSRTGGVTGGQYGPFTDEPLRRQLLDISDTEKWGVSPARIDQFRSFRDRFQGEYAKAYRAKREGREALQAAAVNSGDWKADIQQIHDQYGSDPAFKSHIKNLRKIEQIYGDLDPIATEPGMMALSRMERDVAKALGLSKTDPRIQAAQKVMGVWREAALTSPAYLTYNLSDAATKNAMTGVGMDDLAQNALQATKNWWSVIHGGKAGKLLGPKARQLLEVYGEDALPPEIDSQIAQNITGLKEVMDTHLDIGLGGTKGRAATRALAGAAMALPSGNPAAIALNAAAFAAAPVVSKLVRSLNAAFEVSAREGQYWAKKEEFIRSKLPSFAQALEAAGQRWAADDLMKRSGRISPIQLGKLLKSQGASDGLIKVAADTWQEILGDATKEGIAKANEVHFDYRDTNIDSALRTGFAFHFWAVRNIRWYAEFLAEHPGIPMMLWRFNMESQRQSEDRNLTQRFRGLVGIDDRGGLGTKIGNALFGREGEVFFNPLIYLSIMGQMKPMKGGEDDPMARQVLNEAGNVGLSLNPAVQFGLNQFGDKLGIGNAPVGNISRPSGMVSALAGALTGAPVDIERPLKGGSFDFNQYYVMKRIAEMSVERRGVPNDPEFVKAMADPSSPIYQEAARQVARENLSSTGTSFLGAPLKFLPQTEQNVRLSAKGMMEVPEGGGLAEKERAIAVRRQQKASRPLASTYDIPNREMSRQRGDSQQNQTLSQQEDEIWQAWKKAGPAERIAMWQNPDVRYVVQKRQLMGYK